MGLEGCSTFSQPGNLFRGLFSAASSMVVSTAASFTGMLAGVGLAPRSNFFGWDDGGLHALEHILIREREVALPSPPRALLHSLPKVWFTSTRHINLLCPELKGPEHMPPSSHAGFLRYPGRQR